jgi:hypothetical protein
MFIKLDIVFSDFVCYTDTRLQKIRKNVKIARHNYDSNSISRYSMIMIMRGGYTSQIFRIIQYMNQIDTGR